MDKTKEQERDFIISFEVIQLEKKTITQFFNIWENLQENHQKTGVKCFWRISGLLKVNF